MDVKEVDIRFPAPGRPGMYNFVVYVRSDSYIDIDLKHEFTVTVEEKVEEEILPEMWDSEAESDVDGEKFAETHFKIFQGASLPTLSRKAPAPKKKPIRTPTRNNLAAIYRACNYIIVT